LFSLSSCFPISLILFFFLFVRGDTKVLTIAFAHHTYNYCDRLSVFLFFIFFGFHQNFDLRGETTNDKHSLRRENSSPLLCNAVLGASATVQGVGLKFLIKILFGLRRFT